MKQPKRIALEQYLVELEQLCKEYHEEGRDDCAYMAIEELPKLLRIVREIRDRADRDHMVYAGEVEDIAEAIINEHEKG